MESATPQTKSCRHIWEPFADATRIWQVCAKCGEEQHVTTHADQLMQSLAYVLRR
jgi:hypothetical protein